MVGLSILSNQMYNAVQNPKTMKNLLYYSVLLFGAFHFTRMGLNFASVRMLSAFGKPNLVRETSKIHTRNPMAIPFLWTRRFYMKNVKRRSEADIYKGVILEKELEMQLKEITYAVLNRRKHYAPAKNMLFYGPPGTGKTLFAKKLAMESGLEYAVMVGSDIAPLGTGAVTELNSLFDWAERQSTGMVLFIDEADAFLRKRSTDLSENLRHTVNTFLYRTGTPSEKIIVVLGSN